MNTRGKNPQFNLTSFAEYTEIEQPGGRAVSHLNALQIVGGPPEKERFVIEERMEATGFPVLFTFHYFESREEMLKAFKLGLSHRLKRDIEREGETHTPDAEEIARRSRANSNPFLNHPGHIRSTEDEATPWYRAEEGETIEGDWVTIQEEVLA